jgi:hypothetical protein
MEGLAAYVNAKEREIFSSMCVVSLHGREGPVAMRAAAPEQIDPCDLLSSRMLKWNSDVRVRSEGINSETSPTVVLLFYMPVQNS